MHKPKEKKPPGRCGFFLVEAKPIGLCRSANSGSNGGGPVKKLTENFSGSSGRRW